MRADDEVTVRPVVPPTVGAAAAASVWVEAESARAPAPPEDGYLRAQGDGVVDGLERPGAWLLLAESGEATVGMVGGFPADDPEVPAATGYVAWIGVRPGWWRRGIGVRLLAAAEARAAEAGDEALVLWVHADNQRARRFYEIGGWRPSGRTMLTPVTAETLLEYRRQLRWQPSAAAPGVPDAGGGTGEVDGHP